MSPFKRSNDVLLLAVVLLRSLWLSQLPNYSWHNLFNPVLINTGPGRMWHHSQSEAMEIRQQFYWGTGRLSHGAEGTITVSVSRGQKRISIIHMIKLHRLMTVFFFSLFFSTSHTVKYGMKRCVWCCYRKITGWFSVTTLTWLLLFIFRFSEWLHPLQLQQLDHDLQIYILLNSGRL